MRPIHIAHLDKARPVLVLTRKLVILERTQLTVAPVTSTARCLSVEIPVGQANGLGDDSVVNCDNIVTIPKMVLGERIGYLLPAQEAALTAAIHAALRSRMSFGGREAQAAHLGADQVRTHRQ